MYFPFPPPSPPAGTTQNGKLAESTFTETENVNIVLTAPGFGLTQKILGLAENFHWGQTLFADFVAASERQKKFNDTEASVINFLRL